MNEAQRAKKKRRLKRRKERAFAKQKGLCWLCMGPMDATADPTTEPNAATWDHLIPRSLGGGKTLGNLLLAHKACNARRDHSRDPWL